MENMKFLQTKNKMISQEYLNMQIWKGEWLHFIKR